MYLMMPWLRLEVERGSKDDIDEPFFLPLVPQVVLQAAVASLAPANIAHQEVQLCLPSQRLDPAS